MDTNQVYGTAWARAILLPRFVELEDPETCMFLDRHDYNDQYGEAMKNLCDGLDRFSVVEYFFEETPLIEGRWCFRSDYQREEVYEMFLEYVCTDKLNEIQVGETEEHACLRNRSPVRKKVETEKIKKGHTVKQVIKSREQAGQVMERYVKVCELLKIDMSNKQKKKLIR